MSAFRPCCSPANLAAGFLLALCLVFLTGVSHAGGKADSDLAANPSPYLALHAKDPVRWQPWDSQALERARKENKLLFLTVGYYACHWCHVMQAESFSNPEIAEFINKHFVPVVVDREVDVALDVQLQTFAAQTRGYGGWPLNAFITPEGYPLLATLYAPPDRFFTTLKRVAERWSAEGPHLAELARKAAVAENTAGARPESTKPWDQTAYRGLQRRLGEQALAEADVFRGGFGNTSKFPLAPRLQALLTLYARSPEPKLGEFLKLTLDQMADQGLRDPVGGGFFRYTVDPDWHQPHFEKMLADNAQLASLYFRAASILSVPRYRRVAFDTLAFMTATLWNGNAGGFASSVSAVDADGREGGVYLWEPAQLKALLTPEELRVATRAWQLDKPREFPLGYLPMNKTAVSEVDRPILENIYRKLAKARASRKAPIDVKLLTAPNGLALAAISEIAAAEPAYRPQAQRLRDFLINNLWRGGRLSRGESKGRDLGPGELDSYAYGALGLLAYARLTGREEDRGVARQMLRQAWSEFRVGQGWRRDRNTLLAIPLIEPALQDGAEPSPSAALLEASLDSGDPDLVKRALAVLGADYPLLLEDPLSFPTEITAGATGASRAAP